MMHLIATWLLVAAFLGAGIVNAIGREGTKSDFARWGYPSWWNLVTGGIEIVCAALIALPITRVAGLALGAVIIAVAVVTVLRHRDFSHLAPLALFAVLIGLAAIPY